MIEISNLYKYYGARKAVGPLSFSIATGEIVGLLGLNGAGKTTTLRILACDLLPSSGSVRVDGLDVVDRPDDVRQRIGYLPDLPPLYPEMSVYGYLQFAARLRGLSAGEAARRVPEALEATRLLAVKDDLIESLSHGFRQRVGIAQAIVHKPRLLVLDEPITGLDPVQIVEMRELLRDLKGAHTILLSSHILSEISETCDRLLVIRNGRIGAQGTENELSAKLLQTQQVELIVRTPRDGYRTAADRVVSLARQIDGVLSVEPTGPEDAAEDALSLVVESDRDVREALCAAMVRADVGVLELRRKKRELESVFMQLIGSEAGPRPASAKPLSKREPGAPAAAGVEP